MVPVRYMDVLVFLVLHLVSSAWSYSTYLNAAIVGYKDQTNFKNYQAVADKLDTDNPLSFCKLNLTEVVYDKADGPRVYHSLTYARSLFEDDHMSIAIGPYIDVFTSIQYVIQKQVHIVTSSIEKPEPSKRTFPILPDANSMSSAIAKIVKRLNWKKVAFLSQDDFAPVLSLSQQNIFVLPIQLPAKITSKDDTELRQTLTTLRRAHMEKFVLHSMKRDVVKHVINAAEDLHLLHHSRKWFVTYLDFEDVFKQTALPKSAKLFGLQLLDSTRLTTGIPGEYFKTKSRFEIAVLVDTVNMLRHFLSVSIDCSAEPEYDKFMTANDLQAKITPQENPFIGALGAYRWIQSMETHGQVKTKFSMNITRIDVGNTTVVGQCTFRDSGPILSVEKELVGITELNLEDVLKDKNFTVMTRLEPPFVQRRSDGKIEGFCVDILHEVSSMMNFEFNIRFVEKQVTSWGDFELNIRHVEKQVTSWDDVIQKIVEGSGDIIIGSLDVRSSREEKISFSTTILDSSISVLLQKPPATPTFFQFLWPFTTQLWMTILLIFFVVGGALYLMGRYDSTQRQSEHQFDLKESLWYSLNVILQGGTDYSPQTTSMRTIVAIYWFCTLIITTAYTANLAAFLTLKNIDNRVKSVEGLAAQKKISYGVLRGSDVAEFFAETDTDLYQRMWTYMKLNEDEVIMSTRDQARRMVHTDGYVFLDDGVINDHYAMEHCKTLESIDQGFGSKQYSFGFPRGAPYGDDINRALLILKENGRLDKLKDKWWVSNCTQAEQEQTLVKSSSELEIENMFGVFLVLMGSVVLAVIVEIGKRIRLKVQKKYEENKKNKEQST